MRLVDDVIKEIEHRVGERHARGHGDLHHAFEEKEEQERGAQRKDQAQPQRMPAEEPKVIKQKNSNRAVHRDDLDQRDKPDQAATHQSDGAPAVAVEKRLILLRGRACAPPPVQRDHRAANQHDAREPEGPGTTARPLAANETDGQFGALDHQIDGKERQHPGCQYFAVAHGFVSSLRARLPASLAVEP